MVDRQILTYEANGVPMHGALYLPERAEPLTTAVLVFSEAPGPGPFVHRQGARLAELGHAALVCDLHGEGALITDPADMTARIVALRAEPSQMRQRGRAALDALVARLGLETRQVAAIGYCFGGAMALELGRGGAGIAGIAGFHSTLTTNFAPSDNKLRCPVLVCLGADDPMIDVEQRRGFEEEMRGYGIDWQMHVYGGALHGFTNPAADTFGRPEALRYDPAAAARSWAALLGFFEDIFA